MWRIAGIQLCCIEKCVLSRASLREEVRVLLVHGVLHLLGHDHELGEERHQSMAAEEKEILGALGWKVGLPALFNRAKIFNVSLLGYHENNFSIK